MRPTSPTHPLRLCRLTPLSCARDPQVKRARAKQLSPDEYTTGTFVISNLGMFGVESFDAILPPGEGAPPWPCPPPRRP